MYTNTFEILTTNQPTNQSVNQQNKPSNQLINVSKSMPKIEKKMIKPETESETKKIFKTNKFPKEMNYNNNKYLFLGMAYNEYYNQYYLLYEYEVQSDISNILEKEQMKYLNYKIYNYILVKINKSKPEIIHAIGPRTKININDVVYLSYGTFQLGPLVIKN